MFYVSSLVFSCVSISFVLDPPEVELKILPDFTIPEGETLTLQCNIVRGNPHVLDRVIWFQNGNLIRELPDSACSRKINKINGTAIKIDNQFCTADPTELIFENVRRFLSGNFSCSGANQVGQGRISYNEQLIVTCKYFYFKTAYEVHIF